MCLRGVRKCEVKKEWVVSTKEWVVGMQDEERLWQLWSSPRPRAAACWVTPGLRVQHAHSECPQFVLGCW